MVGGEPDYHSLTLNFEHRHVTRAPERDQQFAQAEIAASRGRRPAPGVLPGSLRSIHSEGIRQAPTAEQDQQKRQPRARRPCSDQTDSKAIPIAGAASATIRVRTFSRSSTGALRQDATGAQAHSRNPPDLLYAIGSTRKKSATAPRNLQPDSPPNPERKPSPAPHEITRTRLLRFDCCSESII